MRKYIGERNCWRFGEFPRPADRRPEGGFTLVEILVVLICLVVAAMLVLPVISDTGSHRVRAAARILVADLEFAQSQSMANSEDPHLLVIDPDGLGYHIARKSDPTEPVVNPLENEPYVIRFGVGRMASMVGVGIAEYELEGDNQLGFGAFGELDQTTPATLTLSCGDLRIVLTLDPVTGAISVSSIR